MLVHSDEVVGDYLNPRTPEPVCELGVRCLEHALTAHSSVPYSSVLCRFGDSPLSARSACRLFADASALPLLHAPIMLLRAESDGL
jgi:hypothetical protein